jgi:hypothetical protein
LYVANKEGNDEYFYKVKNEILCKYGSIKEYDIQFIDGKKCLSCNGTGIYSKTKNCFYCVNGWYKAPCWNLLQKIKFGKYSFYKPIERFYTKPSVEAKIIGYIKNEKKPYGFIAKTILFLLYENSYLKRWYNSLFKPRNNKTKN